MANNFLYGAYYVQIARRDSDGYPMGVESDPDNVANGTNADAYLLRNVRAVPQPQPAVEYVIDRGGQKIRAKKYLGITDFGETTLELSERDDLFHSYITSTSIKTDYPSNWRQTARNVNIATPPSWFVIVSVQSEVVDDVNDTTTPKWFHHVFPNVQFFPQEAGATQNGGDTPNPLVYNMVINSSKRHISGQLFRDSGFNITSNSDIYTTIECANPIALTTYVEKSSPDGTFNAGYMPLTATTTGDKTLTKEGVHVAITSASITTGEIVAAAGTAGQRFVFLYEADLDDPV